MSFPHLEDYPKTFSDAATAQFNRLTAGSAAGSAILGTNAPSVNPFSSDEDVTNFSSRRSWALTCIATARDWTFDYLADLLRFLRLAVTEKFIAPRQATKHRIEIAEIFLYVLGGLIALGGQIGGTRSGAPHGH